MRPPQLLLAVLCIPVVCLAQTKLAPPAPADYGQWESLITYEQKESGLSPDGKWLVYGIDRANGNNEMRILNLATGAAKTVPFGADPTFSGDSRWLAYKIGFSEAQTAKLKKEKKPVENKIGLLNLEKNEETVVNAIESFAFSPNSQFVAMKHYAPEKKDQPTATPPSVLEDEPAKPGATLIVRQLASARDYTFGNVGEFLWQDWRKQGRLLAMVIETGAPDQPGNGVQLFDGANGSLRVLDSGAASFSDLVWRKDSADLVALRSVSDAKRRGTANNAIAWTQLGESSEAVHHYDFKTGDLRIVAYRQPVWADDAKTIFLGLARWDEKPPKPSAADKDKKDAAEDERPSVDVWHWRDTDVMPKQKLGAGRDAHFNMLAAWNLESGTLVQLGKGRYEQVSPIRHQSLAWAADWKDAALERSIGRPSADLYLVDIATGTRTKVRERVPEDYSVHASPGGHYLLFHQNENYWTVNTATKAVVNITAHIKTSFVDRESDFTSLEKPNFGVAGWLKDDAAVLINDKFDLWKINPDGSKAVRLTDGAEHEIRYRYVRVDSDEEFIDPAKPMYLSLFGIWSKQSGYARIDAGAEKETHLIVADKNVAHLAVARDAGVLAYSVESFEESPNLFISTANANDWKDAKAVVKTNEFQSKYAWSRSELIEYKDSQGQRLQGALFYPAGFEPGKKYPMVVYMYEKLSNSLHVYSPLSERRYYDSSAFTSHGYFLLMPDIRFRPREPGLSVADCVGAAVKKALENNAIDGHKVGVVGHSWGGFDSVFLATHSKMFAAAVAGAPITDLVSNYGNHHWSSGIAETDHIETGQQRMQVPLWEDLPAYIRNSAVFNVQNMTTPLLIEVGDSDGTVFFHQGVELYNIARRARKEVVLIEYAGEDHGLRKKPDQIDYQRRIFAWFDHYLKGEPAQDWIANGESYLDHQRALANEADSTSVK